MLSFLLSALAAVSLALPAAPQQADKDVAKGKVGKEIRSWVESAASTGFRGAVLAAKDGKVVAAFGVGHADLEGKVAVDSNTLFEIASVTKQFTAAAVMHLVQDGKVELEEPIGTYLPGIPKDCRAITVRHLLQHTSGIPRSNSQGAGDDLAAVLPLFFQGGPKHKPGTHFEYWNQGYALLSEIIARTSGMSYTDYLRTQLFQPAGMELSLFTGDAAPVDAVVAIGSGRPGEPRSALAHPYGAYGLQYRGMGGAVTNVWDFWRWDRALHDNKILSEEHIAMMFEGKGFDYALGWYVTQDPKGRTMHSHSGGVRGFSSYAYRFPEQDACVLVFSNDDRVKTWQIALGVREILFEDERTLLPPPAPLKSSFMKALLGSYRSKDGSVFHISQDGVITRAHIVWSERQGFTPPDTHATLGQGEKKKDVVLYSWAKVYDLDIERKGSGPVTGFRYGSVNYERVD